MTSDSLFVSDTSRRLRRLVMFQCLPSRCRIVTLRLSPPSYALARGEHDVQCMLAVYFVLEGAGLSVVE